MRVEGVVEEAALQIALLGGLTLLAGKTRLIEKFPETNALGIFYPLPFDVVSIVGASIIHEEAELKPINAIILKNAFILSTSLIAATQAYFIRDRVQLPFKSSLRLGLAKTIIITYSALPFLFKRMASRAFDDMNYNHDEPCHAPHLNDPINPTATYTHYSGYLSVSAYRTSIDTNPKNHLRDFSNLLSTNWNNNTIPKISARFINEEGLDAGGVGRDYCDSLFKALSKDVTLFEGLPHVENNSDIETFRHIGVAFMYFYQVGINIEPRQRVQTGLHFEDNLFEAILTLKADEIDTSFQSLSNDVKLRVAYALYPEYYNHFKNNETSESTVEFFNKKVAPVHALAQGMKSKCHLQIQDATPNTHWDTVIKPTNPIVLNSRIQGSLDRDKIAEAFTLDLDGSRITNHIQTKHSWLQEWIRNDATELELKQLLKFATGSSSLPKGGATIEVHSERVWDENNQLVNIPFPISHTCNPSIGLSPDPCELNGYNNQTEQGFIQCMKLAIDGDASFTRG